jgi:hypothetical protein
MTSVDLESAAIANAADLEVSVPNGRPARIQIGIDASTGRAAWSSPDVDLDRSAAAGSWTSPLGFGC